jgi:hypothetical protein
MENHQPKRWHSRRYLPHFEGGKICQFITIRLGDSLPKNVWLKWEKVPKDFSVKDLKII